MDNNNPANSETQDMQIQNPDQQSPVKSGGGGFVGFMNSIPVKLMGLFKRKNKPASPPMSQDITPGMPVSVEQTPQPSSGHTPHVEVPQAVAKNYKKIILLGGGGLIVLLLVVTGILYLTRPKPMPIVPTPTPEPVAPIATPTPTKYASDSGVIQIEENLKILEKNLGNTDLSEENIKPRALDFNVSFR